jgi:hypothetical protein
VKPKFSQGKPKSSSKIISPKTNPIKENTMDNNLTDDTERQAVALVRYQAQYNNETYQAVQTAVIGDLCGEAFAVDAATRETLLDKEVPNLLMNLLTDTALSMCGYPYTQDKRQFLVNEALQHNLSAKTIRVMSQHLENFEAEGGHFSADFENAALTLLKIAAVRTELAGGISVSSAIHGTKGRAAHHLLKAAAAFLHTAELLLKGENNQAYLNEKLMQGASGLADALIEIQSVEI